MAAPLAPWPGLVIPVMDAKKHRYFTALYRGGERITEYLDAGAADIARAVEAAAGGGTVGGAPSPADGAVLLTGPDAPLLQAELAGVLLDPAYRNGKSRELLAISQRYGIVLGNVDNASLGPMYLRKSDAELTHSQ
jgi:tRNA threonylcarbamoyladenosine biosynthesis protein TsaB